MHRSFIFLTHFNQTTTVTKKQSMFTIIIKKYREPKVTEHICATITQHPAKPSAPTCWLSVQLLCPFGSAAWNLMHEKKKLRVDEEGEQGDGMECGLQLWPTTASWDFLIMQHTEKTDVSWWTHGRELTVCLTPLAGLRSTAEFMQLWWCDTRPSSSVTSLHMYMLVFFISVDLVRV